MLVDQRGGEGKRRGAPRWGAWGKGRWMWMGGGGGEGVSEGETERGIGGLGWVGLGC